ncbi:MAG TPA: AraC family transcriptional regulator [Gammaproteobacteria bacterium]|nr:AraC family transcriptional regulator [Gammaproteobacteria bacterium]
MNKFFNLFQPTITEPGLKYFGLSLEYSFPCKILQGVVHSYLQIKAEKSTPYPVIPDGSQSIFISPQCSMISGAQLKVRDIQILEPGEYFGIRFYPGALRYFFNLDLSEITDQLVDEKYFPSRTFGNLHDTIYRCQHFRERAAVCEKWLSAHYSSLSTSQFDQALGLIYQSAGNLRINQLSDHVGWSARHLSRIFKLRTGLNAKTFSQIIRIQNACRQLYKTPGDSLETALALGFFDQPHLNKDFKKYLLANPRDFFDRFKSDFYNQ